MLIDGFSRSEASLLSGLPVHRIEYLDRSDLLKPERFKLGKKNNLVYSYRKILELKAISKLRENLSLQTIRKVINFLEENAEDSRLACNDLIVINDCVYWLEPELIVQILGSNPGQILHFEFATIPSLDKLSSEVFNTAENSKVIDFESFKSRARLAV